MARFTKHNNPAKKRRRKSNHSADYLEQINSQARLLIMTAESEETATDVTKALSITLNP